eukprot:MONOS_3198.1-p1 / transcript=MONOS_3198.1 / gene=MONOS_3198 / organism=Monocercomonoides_exilis_PA203 / gene_product=unspecified product / transcript_product=unspecified product / location=Mono_scaffold00073:65946-66389(+) / protein_length=110 / sequence_SO=supercontig / SO=protein_coding / is_pseudo=false
MKSHFSLFFALILLSLFGHAKKQKPCKEEQNPFREEDCEEDELDDDEKSNIGRSLFVNKQKDTTKSSSRPHSAPNHLFPFHHENGNDPLPLRFVNWLAVENHWIYVTAE